MGVDDRLNQLAELIREGVRWAEVNTITAYASLDDYHYYVDLGDFGEQSLYLNIEEIETEVDAESALDNMRLGTHDLRSIADELDDIARSLDGEEYVAMSTAPPAPNTAEPQREATLDDVLTRMEMSGQGALAKAIRGVVRQFNSGTGSVAA